MHKVISFKATSLPDDAVGAAIDQVVTDSPPTAPHVEDQRWFADPPTAPGFYWFFGELRMGQMGGHYTGKVQPATRLTLVEIRAAKYGLLAVADGMFVSLKKWNGSAPGYYGKWTYAVLPDTSCKEVQP